MTYRKVLLLEVNLGHVAVVDGIDDVEGGEAGYFSIGYLN